MDNLWRVEMLGGLRLLRGAEVITRFRTQKTAALLAFLAFHLRRPHPREELIQRFWPEDDFDTARHKLNVAVSSLRLQLEPPGVPDRAVLLTDRLSIGLNPASVATDVPEFEAALRDLQREGDEPDRAERLRRAVALYRGPLLAGFDDDWIVLERQRLVDLFMQALRRLTEQLGGDRIHALDDGPAGADPLCEAAHTELMRLLAAAGRSAAALRQYRELERVLAGELGAGPTAATRPLARELKTGRGGDSATRRGDEGSKERRRSDLQFGYLREAEVIPNSHFAIPRPPVAPSPLRPLAPSSPPELEPIGGAVPLGSPYYVERLADAEFRAAVGRGDSTVLVKGARQVGKSSLLARGLDEARHSGAQVVLTDIQLLNPQHLQSSDSCLLALAESLAEELDLEVAPGQDWKAHRGPNPNFRRYMRREVLGRIEGHLVWGLDHVDQLFTCDFGNEIFALFRALHNERALNPAGPWSRLTLAIAYATEAHLFITDLNQSPFNVGTRLALEDFTIEQVLDLNQRYGAPLRDRDQIDRLYRLVGGHPYLLRRGLHEMASRATTLGALEERADQDDGILGDHLRRMLILLSRDAELAQAVQLVLAGQSGINPAAFCRLRSAGVLAGDSETDVRPRCQLYARYLARHLP